jgi:hypothetical protein
MKPLLALVALGLTTLIFEEKARQVAGDVQRHRYAGQRSKADGG